MTQTLIAAVLVVLCAGYAAWAVMPSAGRRWIARALLARPLPGFLARRLARHAAPSTGCGCDGCDQAAGPAEAKQPLPATATITFHPRRKH